MHESGGIPPDQRKLHNMESCSAGRRSPSGELVRAGPLQPHVSNGKGGGGLPAAKHVTPSISGSASGEAPPRSRRWSWAELAQPQQQLGGPAQLRSRWHLGGGDASDPPSRSDPRAPHRSGWGRLRCAGLGPQSRPPPGPPPSCCCPCSP